MNSRRRRISYSNSSVFVQGYALTDVELALALKVLDEDGSGHIELKEFTNCQLAARIAMCAAAHTRGTHRTYIFVSLLRRCACL